MSAYGTASAGGGLPVSTQEDGSSSLPPSRRIALALGVAGIFGGAMVSMNNHVASSAGMKGLSASEGAAVAELSVTNKIKPVDKPLYGEMSAGDIEQLFGEYLTLPHRPARHSYQRRQRATRGVGGIPLTLLLSVLSLARPPTRSPARSTPAF